MANGTTNDEENVRAMPKICTVKMMNFSTPTDISGETMTFPVGGERREILAEGIVDVDGTAASSSSGADAFMNDKIRGNKNAVAGRSLARRRNGIEIDLSTVRDALMDDLYAGDCHLRDDAPESASDRGGTLSCSRFRHFFLNPSYSLRRQMLLTFGSISSLTILFVMLVSIVSSVATGKAIMEESTTMAENWVDDYMSTTTRVVAQTLSPKIMPTALVDLMVEVALDRFSGYPTTEDDSKTPFFDTQSQTNVYPLKNDPLPLEWDFRHTPNEGGNVFAENSAEHVQNRLPWYSVYPRLSTKNAAYAMQGACDPRATDPDEMGYYFNCTDANNDVSTGGDVAPSPTNAQVYRKAADLSPFLKALYESHQDMAALGYYFSNSGAGSVAFFPHYELDSSASYESIGCEWMRMPNPVDPSLGPIGTDEEIARCHPAGTVVPAREYNSLERAWCRNQALNPRRVHTAGPFKIALSADERWVMNVGRAVYDRLTNAFICCIADDFHAGVINKILKEVQVDTLGAVVTLVRNDDVGTVVSSPNYDFDTANSTTTVSDPALGTGIDREMFDQIRSTYAKENSFESEGYVITAEPIPSAPDQYDPTYVPEFFVLFSTPKTSPIFLHADETARNARQRVTELVVWTLIIGVVGLAAVLFLTFLAASFFREPLKWMNDVGDQVVGKFGDELESSIDFERKKSRLSRWCSPQTELSSLVEEFTKLISRFSGEGTAKRVKMTDIEKANLFDCSEDFADLYRSRDDSAFAFDYSTSQAASVAMEGKPVQLHLGPNTQSSPEKATETARNSILHVDVEEGKVHQSPVFRWMIGLIVTPILLTTVLISILTLWQISTALPSLTDPVKEDYYSIRKSYRSAKTNLLAISASEVADRAARDTYFLTRLASWLYFDGVGLQGSFTELYQGGAEACKTTPSDSTCDWNKDFPCDCKWNDFYTRGSSTCKEYSVGNSSRHQQKLYFEGQNQDVDKDGTRNSTSYPEVASSPSATSWWDSISALPGSTEESMSSNYENTYSRMKTYSALSTVSIPLYNYDKSDDKPLAMFIGFEADGIFAGYGGCWYNFTNYPFWTSSEGNGGHKIRPDLCPIGKYGFDPRCRGWYADGKKKALSINRTAIHITAPYIFAGTPITGLSTSSPLIDPRNNEHIGQTIVDFTPDPIFKSLESDGTNLGVGGFPIMITPEIDVLGHDTLVGPGFSLDGQTRAIGELLQADDAFETILSSMKAGNSGTGVFSGVDGNSRDHHQLNITYAPVVVRSYRPLNSSDFGSGVEQQNITVYSLAFIDPLYIIMESFQDINEYTSKIAIIAIGAISTLAVVSTMFIIYVAFLVTKSMTVPILQLLGVMKGINSERMSNDDIDKLTEFKGSCREIDIAYKTMEKLYKVVRIANCAFFSGDLDVAYQVLKDALRLFGRLDNEKAIAVASNNLGNIMLTFYRTMKATGCKEMCGLSVKDVVAKGSAYFALSIKLGESAYDEFYNKQGWSEECLVFMQFLANRYFNRAIFFLTSSCDSEDHKKAESSGFRDLQIAADMDLEIVDQCLEMGFKINKVERYELMMSRVRGLLSLVEIGYNPEEVFVEDQINDVYQDLVKAMKSPSHELFEGISIAGRMQKLDTELIKYFKFAKQDNTNAARVAIRMLVEDEYVFPDAEQEAIKMVSTYLSKKADENCPEDENGDIARELGSEIETIQLEIAHRASLSIKSSESNSMRAMGLDLSERSEDREQKIVQSIRNDTVMELY